MGLVHCLMLHQKPFVIFLGLLSGNNINTPSCIIFFKVLTPEYVHNVVTRIQLVEATLETITPRNRWKFGWFDNDVNIPFKRFFSEVATNFPKEVDPLYENSRSRITRSRTVTQDPSNLIGSTRVRTESLLTVNIKKTNKPCPHKSQPLRHTNIRRDFLPSKLAEHDRYARNLTNMINWENEPKRNQCQLWNFGSLLRQQKNEVNGRTTLMEEHATAVVNLTSQQDRIIREKFTKTSREFGHR
ncbi:unnamed protein product [Rhizophagus irregularis]|nr:unnamed protein product [Rhizophagus irregularis]